MALKNKWLIITRPAHQAENLRLRLEAAGANPILFPLIEIAEPQNLAKAKQQLENLQTYDLIIFVSANAVEKSLPYLQGMNPSILDDVKIAATGKKTAATLKQLGVKIDFCPKEIFNSEALLAQPNFKAFYTNKKIAIIRGEDGRNYLRDQLQLAGASVEYIDAYQRICPQKDSTVLEQYANQGKLDAILLTSGTSVTNFFNLVKSASWVNRLTLLLGSPRMEKRIPNSFQGKLVIAEDPSDETLFKKLIEIYK